MDSLKELIKARKEKQEKYDALKQNLEKQGLTGDRIRQSIFEASSKKEDAEKRKKGLYEQILEGKERENSLQDIEGVIIKAGKDYDEAISKLKDLEQMEEVFQTAQKKLILLREELQDYEKRIWRLVFKSEQEKLHELARPQIERAISAFGGPVPMHNDQRGLFYLLFCGLWGMIGSFTPKVPSIEHQKKVRENLKNEYKI